MNEVELADLIWKPKNRKILMAFAIPKTPTEVQQELNICKINLKPFLKLGLMKCLNPETHKGRLYSLTNKSRKLLKIPNHKQENQKKYDVIGKIMASPKQKYVIMKTIMKDTNKRTSEEIRVRSSNLNSCLTRISTKAILKELIIMELVDSEMGIDRRRYYWITGKGRLIANDFFHLYQK